jgi:hypothetical protein
VLSFYSLRGARSRGLDPDKQAQHACTKYKLPKVISTIVSCAAAGVPRLRAEPHDGIAHTPEINASVTCVTLIGH